MARPHRKKPPLSPEQVEKNAKVLEIIGQSTKSIREAQESIVNLSKTRTEAVLYARENGVSYQVLATAMGTSEQTVYKIVKPYLKKKEQADDL